MHIPDGFLSTPVWAALDVAAVPAAGYVVRKAQREFELNHYREAVAAEQALIARAGESTP